MDDKHSTEKEGFRYDGHTFTVGANLETDAKTTIAKAIDSRIQPLGNENTKQRC